MMDEALIGCWCVKTQEHVENQMLQLIGGQPGDLVEFTASGKYVWDLARDPMTNKYRAKPRGRSGALDIWDDDLADLGARCIYRVAGNSLTICIAANSGKRPTALRRDDKKLWCLVTLERAERPRKRKTRKRPALLTPGRLIPDSLLSKPRRTRPS